MNEKLEEEFDDMADTIGGWVCSQIDNVGNVLLDGYFSSKELRRIADWLDKYNKNREGKNE